MSIKKFFKIVQPRSDLFTAVDNQDIAGNLGMYGNYTWYHRLVQGSASRMVRYREYDLMDNDVDVARALDLTAEEIAGNQTKLEMPLKLQITAEHEQDVSSSVVVTLNAALKTWCNIQQWSTRIFPAIRTTIKYGDCFFLRPNKKFDKFLFIHPKNVVGALVLETDITKVEGWHIKTDFKRTQAMPGVSNEVAFTGANDPHAHNIDLFRATEIVRFTLNNDMTDEAPFGESILKTIYKTFKQKELLEDALIIYRIQRAPERRVFYIDVGKMPPHKVAAHLESVKNEFRQKRVPTPYGGKDHVESVYNPQCLDLNTIIPLLDGRDLTLKQLIQEFSENKENWTYSINPETGETVPGKIDWAGVTRKNTEVIKITLDDGSEFIMTPDHKIPVQGKGYVEAKDLTINDSLFSYNEEKEKVSIKSNDYHKVYDHNKKDYIFTHRMVANYFKNLNEHDEMLFDVQYENCQKNTIHHKDYNRFNNNPDNLAFMHGKDHMKYHFSVLSQAHKAGLFDNSGYRNKSLRISDEMYEYTKNVYLQNKEIKKWDLFRKLSNDAVFMDLFKKSNDYVDNESYLNKINLDKLSEKAFERIFESRGFVGFREFRNSFVKDSVVKIDKNIKPEHVELCNYIIQLIKEHKKPQSFALVKIINNDADIQTKFNNYYNKSFITQPDRKPIITNSTLNNTVKRFGYKNFKQFTINIGLFNHKIIKIETVTNRDVGTLTIDGYEKYNSFHNFPIKSTTSRSGIYVKNSMNEDFFFARRGNDGGTTVETLPSGMNLGELDDLNFFFKKLWRGLRIPQSYMDNTVEGGTPFTDGKVGIAYMQEILFTLYIEKMQKLIETTLDREFKRFLYEQNIKIDSTIYKIILPSPTNFKNSRDQAMDAELINNYKNIIDDEFMSPRFAQRKYLKMEEKDFLLNQRLKLEEKGIDPDKATKADLMKLYSPEDAEAGGFDGGIGGGSGGDDFLNQPLSAEDEENQENETENGETENPENKAENTKAGGKEQLPPKK